MSIDLKKYDFLKNKTIESFMLLKHQGHCNNNYLLQTPHQNYLIRKFKLQNDRKSEFKVQKIVYKKGIGSKPILLDEQKGLMICEFIEGEHREQLNPFLLKKLSLLLHKLHKIKFRKKITPLKKHFTPKDKKVKKAFILLQKEPQELRLSHNDLHQKNILFSKRNIKLIDWEYAGVNDLYFDLVSIIIEFKLNKETEIIFLKSYFQRKKINYRKIKSYKIIYKELWRLWFIKLEKGEL